MKRKKEPSERQKQNIGAILMVLLIIAGILLWSTAAIAQENIDPHFKMTEKRMLNKLEEHSYPHTHKREEGRFLITYVDNRGVTVMYSGWEDKLLDSRTDIMEREEWEQTIGRIKTNWDFHSDGNYYLDNTVKALWYEDVFYSQDGSENLMYIMAFIHVDNYKKKS